MEKQRFNIKGMTCSACSARIEKTVKNVDGVKAVAVSLLTNSMAVEFSAPATEKIIIDAVRNIGYQAASETCDGKKEKFNPTFELLIRFISSFILLIPLMYVSMGVLMFDFPISDGFKSNPFAIAWYEFAFSLAIIAINYKYFVEGTKSLIKLSPNMDTLVSMGSGISFVYSVALIISSYVNPINSVHLAHNLYFESAAMILTLITFGKMLESLSKGKTTSAIKELISLTPDVVHVIENGVEKEIQCKDLKIGDVFVVRDGERFPCDGEIINGFSSVNESSVTGESLPIYKTVGDSVISGTTNLDGFLTVKAVKVGEEATLGKIVKLVQDAASSKAPISLIADKVSGIFVPAVIGIAIITFIIWISVTKNTAISLTHAISVLVISCPCALGLATPVAIMVGSGRSTKFGILFKTAEALEQTGKADIVVLDKTGTITKGEPKVTDIIALSDFDENEILSIAASLENASNHPIAYAIVSEAQKRNLSVSSIDDFKSAIGHGLIGKTERYNEILLGNASLMKEYKIALNAAEKTSLTLSENGKTPLYLAIDKQLIGIIAVADEIKSDSVKAIADLKRQGFQVVMLTGDNEICARAVAEKCNIDTVIANVLPTEKNAAIKSLQNEGKVIMVGDGINDAPALTQADVGIAIGSGTDVAIDSADVVLIKSGLNDVVRAVNLSRKTLVNIKENLFWAFIYNCVCIPIAAGILSMPPINLTLSPMFAAGAMSLSSVCVCLNALRLNLVNPDKLTKMRKQLKTINQTADEPYSNLKNKRRSDLKDINNKTENLRELNFKGVHMDKQIFIEGMMCSHCSSHVKNALMSIPGVVEADVSLENKCATVKTSKNIDDAAFISAIENAGYTVTQIK
ncbi:MAG: heavy metal translocating P-type ATPase [Christensenellales bacterium]